MDQSLAQENQDRLRSSIARPAAAYPRQIPEYRTGRAVTTDVQQPGTEPTDQTHRPNVRHRTAARFPPRKTPFFLPADNKQVTGSLFLTGNDLETSEVRCFTSRCFLHKYKERLTPTKIGKFT